MLNQFIKHQTSFKQCVLAGLCLVMVAACATTPKGNTDGSLSASERLARIKTTGTSKEPKVKSESEETSTEQTQEESTENENASATQETSGEPEEKSLPTKEAKVQENYDFTNSVYVLPKAKKRERTQPEVSKELRDAYKDALKTFEKGLKNKEYDTALEQFKTLETQYPQFSGPSTNIGMIYLRQEKFVEAETAFKKALEINNENEYAHNNLGLTYRELGKFPEAKQSYQEAIALNPKYAEAHYNLGILAELYLHDLDLAIQSFEYYKLANKKRDEQVDTWLVDLRNRLQASKQVAAQTPTETNQVEEAETQAEVPTEQNQSAEPEAVDSSEKPAVTQNTNDAVIESSEDNIPSEGSTENIPENESSENIEDNTEQSEN